MRTIAIDLQEALRVAVHNGAYAEGSPSTLIVWDGLAQDRHFGIQVEVEPACGGFSSVARDGVGNSGFSWDTDRLTACFKAIDHYLERKEGSS